MKTRWVTSLLAAFLLAVGAEGAQARASTQPGLDPTFGDQGAVLADLGGSSPEMGGQNDGEVVDVRSRIAVAATGLSPTGRRVLVVLRYLKDGTIDPSFGRSGHVRANIHGFNIPLDLVMTDGGAILVLVWTGTEEDSRGAMIVRYTARGRPDRSFGTDGRIDLGLVYAQRLTLQPDGRFIVIVDGVTVMRFLPDGGPDPSFGTSGVVATPLDNGRAVNLSMLPNGKLLLVATSARNTSYNNWVFKLVLARYRANGSPDTGFGTVGVRRYPMPEWSSAEDATVDRDNRIVVLVSMSGGSHSCGDASAGWEVVRRYLPSGDPDASFGRDGHTSIRAFEVRRVATEPNGSLFVVGQGCTGDDPGRVTWAFAAARLREDGSPLLSFAERGVTEHAVAGRQARPSGIALQRDGRLVVAGVAKEDLALVRYVPDGR